MPKCRTSFCCSQRLPPALLVAPTLAIFTRRTRFCCVLQPRPCCSRSCCPGGSYAPHAGKTYIPTCQAPLSLLDLHACRGIFTVGGARWRAAALRHVKEDFQQPLATFCKVFYFHILALICLFFFSLPFSLERYAPSR